MSKKTTKPKYHTTRVDLLEAALHLPKTCDGKPMYPGLDVWLVGRCGYVTGNREARIVAVGRDEVTAEFGNVQTYWPASQIYSSKDAMKGEGAK